MKIIFLDFDGVLNNQSFLKNRDHYQPTLEEIAYAKSYDLDVYDLNQIDSDKVALLNELVSKSEAKIVISSSWRINMKIKQLQAVLAFYGCCDNVIGSTPHLQTQRGYEIDEYLNQSTDQIDSIVILDDDSDMIHLNKYLVKTTFQTGLTKEHVDEALKMLDRRIYDSF